MEDFDKNKKEFDEAISKFRKELIKAMPSFIWVVLYIWIGILIVGGYYYLTGHC